MPSRKARTRKPRSLTKFQKKQVKAITARAVETKHIDDPQGPTDLVDGFFAYGLTDIARGDTQVTRDGDECIPVKLMMNIHFRHAGADDDSLTRFMIVKLRGGDTTPSDGEIVDFNADGVLGQYTEDYFTKKQWTVIYDKFVHLSSVRPVVNFQINRKLRGKMRWTGANAGDYGSGQYFVVFWSSALVGWTTQPTIEYYSRVLFKDP